MIFQKVQTLKTKIRIRWALAKSLVHICSLFVILLHCSRCCTSNGEKEIETTHAILKRVRGLVLALAGRQWDLLEPITYRCM